jgi:hypothetical protein
MATLMDGLQLPLPAGWAREFRRLRDPVEELDELAHDKLAAKAEIRETLDRLAAKHALGAREIGKAVQGYADDMLNDATYERERELTRQIEERDSL